MKTLLVLRHAKSSWRYPDLADHDRPLKKRGKRDAPRIGRLLRDEDLVPDIILCSTARRARETARVAADYCGYEGEIELSRALYAFDPEPYIEYLVDLADEHTRAMVVGHNPGLEELVEILTGDWQRLPTAALVHIELPIQTWRELLDEENFLTSGKIVNIWRPRELPEWERGL